MFFSLPCRSMARPAPDLLARPAVCGHPTDMILTRAPSRALFTLAVKIMSGPQTCSRAPVGSQASRFAPHVSRRYLSLTDSIRFAA